MSRKQYLTDCVERFTRGAVDYQNRDWVDKTIFLNERFIEASTELRLLKDLSKTHILMPKLSGLTMTVKACFDVTGWVTSCASKVKVNNQPATMCASIVEKLLQSGATLVAQTNMTEFAYGALGLNEQFGTPRSPLMETDGHVSGGSSSGAAVGVSLGYSDFAVCSDTSGSARIPAAFCGVTGFKPSRGRYPTSGMGWLSTSFDVPGIIAKNADMCVLVDEQIADLPTTQLPSLPILRQLRFVIPSDISTLKLSKEVEDSFWLAINALKANDVIVDEMDLSLLVEASQIASKGGVISAEAYLIHQDDLATSLDSYDPKVGPRILNGSKVLAHDYVKALAELEICKSKLDVMLAGYDGYLLPTVPILPPKISDLQDFDTYLATNLHAFSLTEPANRLDLPSISLPIRNEPIGLQITGTRSSDLRVLQIATLVERVLNFNCIIEGN